jgi:hypothetical protein
MIIVTNDSESIVLDNVVKMEEKYDHQGSLAFTTVSGTVVYMESRNPAQAIKKINKFIPTGSGNALIEID